MYDYYLGGKDNFEADRVAAEEIMRLVPVTRAEAMTNRQFLRLAVRYLATDAGISQFLDIGVGLPTRGAVHEVAREVSAETRVAYVDYDPVVVSHANALLAKPDRSVAVRGDLREPAALLADPVIQGHLDFSRPVAVVLLAILHFISAADDPARIIATIRDALAPGSYLVVSHVVPGRVQDKEVAKEVADRVYEIYGRASEPLTPAPRKRSRGCSTASSSSSRRSWPGTPSRTSSAVPRARAPSAGGCWPASPRPVNPEPHGRIAAPIRASAVGQSCCGSVTMSRGKGYRPQSSSTNASQAS